MSGDLRGRIVAALDSGDPVAALEQLVHVERSLTLLHTAEVVRAAGRVFHGQPGDRHRRYAMNRAAEVLVRRSREIRRRTFCPEHRTEEAHHA